MSNLGSDVAELIPLALVIAFSPFSIIPGILVLHTPRPRPTSTAFLAGWVLGIAVVTAGFVGASDLTAAAGDFSLSWFNPRDGGPLTAATPATGGAKLTLTAPSTDDWLAIIRRR